MWQYSSDGVVPGSSARTDVNWCYKDYPAIIRGDKSKPSEPNTLTGSTLDLVIDVMRGKYGNGATRSNKLGTRYNEVQGFINHIASASEMCIRDRHSMDSTAIWNECNQSIVNYKRFDC